MHAVIMCPSSLHSKQYSVLVLEVLALLLTFGLACLANFEEISCIYILPPIHHELCDQALTSTANIETFN